MGACVWVCVGVCVGDDEHSLPVGRGDGHEVRQSHATSMPGVCCERPPDEVLKGPDQEVVVVGSSKNYLLEK